jgi:hypothetical protein
MTIDCQWVEKNLEALFCDRLSPEEARLARTHIDSCNVCRNEVAALNAIDPLIKKDFQRQMSLARAPRRARMSFIYATAAAGLAAVLLMAVILRAPELTTVNPLPPVEMAETTPPPPVEAPSAAKPLEKPQELARVKPEPAPPADAIPQQRAVVADKNAPEFLVADPAGYSNTLEDYRGRIAVIGVWSNDQQEATANLDRLYKSFSSNTKLRFVGVTNQRGARSPNTTFTIVYNQG